MIKKLILLSILFINLLTAANINLAKDIFKIDEKIVVNFSDMQAKNNDWIGIYSKGTTNEWKNVLRWNWTNDLDEGVLNFDALPVGSYEIRVFYNNSYHVESKKEFVVKDAERKQATVTTDKDKYLLGDKITTKFNNMSGDHKDWMAIYPADSNNDWKNVLQWRWIDGKLKGEELFKALPVGEYEVRLFFKNSFKVEASHKFSINNNHLEATIKTNKNLYSTKEQIIATFNNMMGDDKDWIAIYPAGSNNDWGNMLQWQWTRGNVKGDTKFEPLPAGDYEVRLFFQNSFKTEKSHPFSVKNNEFNVKSRKEVYDPFELIHADFVNMRGTASDWLGIFSIGAKHGKENAIQWKYARSLVNGDVSFNGLPVGTYEMRAYFATKHKKTLQFKIKDVAPISIIYETAEKGLQQKWITQRRAVQVIGIGAKSQHSVRAFLGNSTYFVFPNHPDKKMRFLELDTRIGIASHVGNFGVKIKTKNGNRRIIFSSYMNHSTHGRNDFSGHAIPTKPFTLDGYLHNHPGPTDYYLKTRRGNFVHYKINIEEKLRILEPDNELLGIELFTTAGGDFDNIKLTTH